MIDAYKAPGVKPRNVYAPSSNLNNVLYWITHKPQFGEQAVFIESRNLAPNNPDTWWHTMEELAAKGVNIIFLNFIKALEIFIKKNLIFSVDRKIKFY